MVAFRFVHTADWHLGQPYANVPELAERLRAARLDAVERTLDAALKAKVDAVLAAGDQFDSPTPDPEWVERLLDLVAARPCLPVFLIPGNHDPLRPGSVYSLGPFQRRPSNLILLDRPEPWPIDGGRVTLYPCPCTARWGDNPLTWIPRRSRTERLRIGLAHGSLASGPGLDLRNYPIDADAPVRYDLDYVALGDWHRPSPDPAADSSARMYYSGAPECGGWDEPEAGHALAVELRDDAPPRVATIRTGQHSWKTIEADLADEGDVRAVLDRLERDADPDTLLRVKLTGCLEPEPRDRLERALEELRPRYAYLESNLDGLACRMNDSEVATADPRVRYVLEALGRLADDPSALPPNWPAVLPRPDTAVLARAWNLARRHLA